MCQQSFVCLCLRYNEGSNDGSGGLWIALCPDVCGILYGSRAERLYIDVEIYQAALLAYACSIGVRAPPGNICPREGLSSQYI